MSSSTRPGHSQLEIVPAGVAQTHPAQILAVALPGGARRRVGTVAARRRPGRRPADRTGVEGQRSSGRPTPRPCSASVRRLMLVIDASTSNLAELSIAVERLAGGGRDRDRCGRQPASGAATLEGPIRSASSSEPGAQPTRSEAVAQPTRSKPGAQCTRSKRGERRTRRASASLSTERASAELFTSVRPSKRTSHGCIASSACGRAPS